MLYVAVETAGFTARLRLNPGRKKEMTVKRSTKAEAVAILSVVALGALAGCTSQNEQARANTDWGKSRWDDPHSPYAWKGDGQPEPTPAPAKATEPSKPAPQPRASVSGNGLAIPTGDRQTSVLWLEKIYPAEVIAGQTFDYDIKVTNLTGVAVDNVNVYDSLPTNFKLASANPTGQPGPNNTMMWSLGSIGPRESKLIHLTGQATGAGQINSCASATFTSALCSTINVVQPALKLAKTAPSDVTICDNIPVKLVVSNSGTGAARNVKVTDNLPAGLKTSDGRTSVTLDAGTLAAGASREFSMTLKADKAGNYTNNASAVADGGLKADSNSTTTKVTQPVLAIKAECPQGVLIGREIACKFTVTNTGDTPAANTVVSAPVPAGTSFSSADNGGSASGGKVNWNLGTLAPNASKTIGMVVRSTNAGTIQLSATATGNCAAAVTDGCTTPVQGVPDIGTLLTDDDGVVLVGDNHVFRYEIKNQGQVDLTNITVVCELSDGLEYVSSTAAVQARVEGKKFTFQNVHAVLKPGEVKNFTITCRGTKPGEQWIQSNTSCAELKRSNRNDEQVNYVAR